MPEPSDAIPAPIDQDDPGQWLDQIAANANELVRLIEHGRSPDVNNLIAAIVADRRAA